jgi:hypothetical protein
MLVEGEDVRSPAPIEENPMTSTVPDTASAQTVLVAGATGMLGGRIAARLLDEPTARVRLLLRPGTLAHPVKGPAVQELVRRGARPVEGELSDGAALRTAVDGVDVVVSALQGGREVVVDGQLALARAAAASGARRILPSDFAVDLFRATPGEHASFDLRREADEAIAATGLQHVHVLNGAFTDGFVSAHGGLLDHGARTAAYWGTGDELFDATSIDTTAHYTARAALDTTLGSGAFAVAGEQLSFHAVVDAAEKATEHTYERRSLGSTDELRAAIAAARTAGATAEDVVMQVYLLYMLTGQTALTDLQNERYPEVVPQTLADLAQRALGDRS